LLDSKDFSKNMQIFTTFYHFTPFFTTIVEKSGVMNSVYIIKIDYNKLSKSAVLFAGLRVE
jgi:hypothetical protein